jgi:hypothetical protein
MVREKIISHVTHRLAIKQSVLITKNIYLTQNTYRQGPYAGLSYVQFDEDKTQP